MKAINTGNTYTIYDDSIKVYNQLPAQSYQVCFSKARGFFLERYNDIEITEQKVYGVHETKVNKVLNSFNLFNRNLGVILSGDKGIGKSLFAKMLAKSTIEQGFPLIVVNTYYPNIADYINNITQEVVVLFDEFDKTFANRDDVNPQTEMLTLFDGISAGKKLFIITCNDLHKLNDYLVNRPGRFHYHFRFEYPKAEEIKEYLEDKLAPEYHHEIDKVITFSHKVNLNYDCLRAIAFELNQGDSFEVAIQDLNILHLDNEIYELTVYFKNGMASHIRTRLDLFDEEENREEFEDEESGYDAFYLTFTPSDAIFDYARGGNVISGNDMKIEVMKYLDCDDPERKAIYDKYANAELDFLSIRHRKNKNLHYSV
jgi:hypothetical protein